MRKPLRPAVALGVACLLVLAPAVARGPLAAQDVAKGVAVPADAPKTEVTVKVEKAVDAPKGEPPKGSEDAKKAEEAELAGLMPQMVQQVRPVVRAEYHFLRAVAAPTQEQRGRVVKDAAKAQRETATALAKAQQQMQRGQWRGDSKYPDGRQLVQAALGASAKAHLQPDQFARYQAEVEKREASRKATAVENLVAVLDHQLVLTAEQRGKLADALAKNWDASWVPSLETFLYGEQFFPNIPEKHFLPVLNPTQRKVWKNSNRNNGMFWGGMGFMMGNNDGEPIDPDFPEEGKPEPAPAAAFGAAVKGVVIEEKVAVEAVAVPAAVAPEAVVEKAAVQAVEKAAVKADVSK